MLLATLCVAAALALPPAATDTFRLADAIAMARAANPMLAAARLRADAATARIAPAGALPDPQLSLALMNRMVARPGSTMDPMTMNQVQAIQMLPWPGQRGARRDQASHLSAALGLDVADAERSLVARVEEQYFRIAFADRAIATSQRTRGLMQDLLAVAEAMYAVGETPQQDVLQAQVAVARMTEDIAVMQAERLAAAARLNALLGRSATHDVGPLELPDEAAPVLPPATLMQSAERHRPALAAARERIRAAEAAYRSAELELYPELMVGLQYGNRAQYADMASVMIGFSLPLWARDKQRPMRREMQAMGAMVQAEALDLVNETFAELTELAADAERSRSLASLYATSVLPQSRAAVDAAVAAYRVGRVDFLSVLENQMTVNRYEIEQLRLLANYHTARARIASLAGPIGGDE